MMPRSTPSGTPSLRDSWPPTQMHLRPSVQHDDGEIDDLDLSAMNEDPLTYFLTPAPLSDDENINDVDFDMEFDAGIEDAKHPLPIVRSVSPSSLEGLSLPPPRPPTPPKSPATPDLELDLYPTPDDVDDYMHFAARARAHAFTLPFSLKDFTAGKSKTQSKQYNKNTTDALLSPSSFHGAGASSRGRSTSRSGPRPLGASQGISGLGGRSSRLSHRHSPHSWREPSPDVWSIEEETEEETHSEMGDSTVEERVKDKAGRAEAIDIPGPKLRKKVRFVLPAKDE
ncbi:hypothetical protein QBC46DRAFT_387585 [Diplogelasinospora grovesii]|uniref:Uncharacterized protein n=1 Tax=Diplogelasinospora grovesii TaxID=303347 RepID=A0AAN6N6R1_9PEZI|nr:hypothetical protein QBC46DRAFT_387585 [Diplogelasinospora grovesii]